MNDGEDMGAADREVTGKTVGRETGLVVGGETVIASSGTRRGLALFATQWQEFRINNLNKLWIDSTVSGDKINYIVEYND